MNRKAFLISMMIAFLSGCAGSPPEPKQPTGAKVPVNPVGITTEELGVKNGFR